MGIELKQRYEVGEQVSKDPLVVVVDDFVTEGERTHIMNLARKKMKRGKVTRVDELGYSKARTGSAAWIPHDQTPLVRGLVKRVSDLVGIPTHHAESLQIVHYSETQQYKPHYDGWELDTEKGRNRTANGGQRLLTVLMYLNEVDGGRSTNFPKLRLEVEPIPGRMVIFHNSVQKRGRDHLHKKALHGGMPVEDGEKWACNLWYRAEPYTRPGKSRGISNTARPKRSAGSKKQRKSAKASRRRNR